MLFLGTLLCLGIVQTFSAVNVFLLRNGTLEIFSEGKRSSFGIFDARAQQVVETMVDEFSNIGVAAPQFGAVGQAQSASVGWLVPQASVGSRRPP